MTLCATTSLSLDEPLSGTAATARTWLLLEQPGPWGAKALVSSHLDRTLGRALEAAAQGTGVRVALIRRPGRHADRPDGAARRVYAAHTDPAHTWLHSATTASAESLLDLDLAALGAGDHRVFDATLDGAPHTGTPLAFVCTNGKRDRCCAVLGRPLAAELAASGQRDVWEITHLGGHRFAPTALVLPHGYAYGRVTAQSLRQILDEAGTGRVVTENCRGGSAWDRPGQVAELAVRDATGERAAGTLHITATTGAAPRWDVTVAHTDGRQWCVCVAQGTSAPPRPESCGGVLGTPARLDAVSVRELPVPRAQSRMPTAG